MDQTQIIELFLKSGALTIIGGAVGREIWRQARRGMFRSGYRKIRSSKTIGEVIGLFWVLLPYLAIGAAAVYFGYTGAVVWIPVVLVGGIISRRMKPAALWFMVFSVLAGAVAWVVSGQPGTLVVAASFAARYAVSVLK